MINVGDTVYFGRYPMRSDEKKEAIEWSVLEMKNGCALLLSKYCLGCAPYDAGAGTVAWRDCSLRKWLNGEFLKAAFSENERKQLVLSWMKRDGAPTRRDKVFLLGADEVASYYPMEEDRITSATQYAIERKGSGAGHGGNAWWWLRFDGDAAQVVTDDGSIEPLPADAELTSIRPAVWVKLDGAYAPRRYRGFFDQNKNEGEKYGTR